MKASLPSKTHGDFRHRRADVSIGPIFARAMSTPAISAAGGRAHPAPGTEARAGSSRIRGPGGIQQLHPQLAARQGDWDAYPPRRWTLEPTQEPARALGKSVGNLIDLPIKPFGVTVGQLRSHDLRPDYVPGLVSLFSPQCAAASLLLPWATPR